MIAATAAEQQARGRLLRAARVLPLITVTAWTVMIWVPIIVSGPHRADERSPTIRVTSFGHHPIYMDFVDTDFVFLWIGILTSAATAWLLTSLRLWSWATTILAGHALAVLIGMIDQPPIIHWDGVRENGERVFDIVEGEAALGVMLWVGGSLSLAAAGVCGVIGETAGKASGFSADRPRFDRGRSA